MSNPPLRSTSIAIVGAGFSGTLLSWHLSKAGISCSLIGEAESFGRGRAHSTARWEHLLNVSVGGMSAFPDRPEDFHAWLVGIGYPSDSSDFAPRRLYGRYLQAISAESGATKIAGIVRSAEPSHGGWHLCLDAGERIQADRLVLATGHRPPPVPALFKVMGDRLIADPYVPDALTHIPQQASVLVVGTGLTAVDAISTLHEAGHRGAITAVSRHGRWPAGQYLAGDRHVLGRRPENRALAYVMWLREELERGRAGGRDWRRVIDAIRGKAQMLWGSLSIQERARLLRHGRNLWDVARHQMPGDSGRRLDELRASGRLISHAARVGAVEPQNAAFEIALDRRNGQWLKLEVDHVVLCTGTQTAPRPHGDHLLDRMLTAGHILADPLGLGVLTDAKARCCRPDGTAHATLFAVGPLRRGTLWENVAVPELREEALTIARHLTASMPTENRGTRRR